MGDPVGESARDQRGEARMPMVTPLCGSSDARLRLAACHLAGALTKLLSAAPQQNATSAPVPSVVAALLQGMAAAAGSADAAADGNVGSDDESPDGVEDVQHTPSSVKQTMNHSARSPARQQRAASNASSGHRCRIPLFHDVFRSQDEDLQRTHGDDLRPPSSASDNAAPALSSDAMMQRYITQYQKTTYAVCFAEAASARSSKDENAPPTRPARQTHPSGTKACGVPSKEYLLSPEGGRNTMFFCLGGRIDQEDTLLPQLFY
ncbi:Hypothetical protein, putative [Bodo saltans]|uniref:Uncharacterized protein n=1 Tax=Bodo saltans TaxID=75058 RepID=A0A0S4J752_BODSA|nr:Hypothetical protein, putative [Bodo saltans]|eukprot:CUG52498.1 Hypothetical protein, putative [Bodo saltans]